MIQDRIDLYQRLRAENLLTLLPFALLALASWAVTNPAASPGGVFAAWSVAVIVGFLLVFIFLPIYVTFAIALREPALTLSGDTLVALRIHLNWCDISRIELHDYWGRPRMFLGISDPRRFLEALPNYVARFYSRVFSRTGNCIVVPSVRGYSDSELLELLQRYWLERRSDRESCEPSYISYPTAKPTEPAEVFAAQTFGFVLSVQWPGFIECIQRSSVRCIMLPLAYSSAAAIGTYIVTWLVLQVAARKNPRFDLWEKIAALQAFVFPGLMPRPRP